MNRQCVPLHRSLSIELCFTMTACIGRGLYVETLYVSHQVSLVVEILLTNSTAPYLGPCRVSLVEALLLDILSYLILAHKH